MVPSPGHTVSAHSATLATSAGAALATASTSSPLGAVLRRTPRLVRSGAFLAPTITPVPLAFLLASARPWNSALAAGALALLLALASWMLGFVGKSSRTRGQPLGMEFAL
jgi:hypothetical protein